MPDKVKLSGLHGREIGGCGFYIHYTPPEGDDEFINYHTHGLEKSRNHKDFQVLLPPSAELVHCATTYDTFVAMPTNLTIISEIIRRLISRIDQGEVFEAGMRIYDPLLDCTLELEDAIENDREVLRIILPEEKG